VHRLAWGLLLLAVAACAVGSLAADRTLRFAATIAGGVLLVAALWFAWANGRRIEARWRTGGVRGELELTSVSPVSKSRLAVVATLHLPDRPAREARYKAYVSAFEHRYVVEGTRVPCTVLDDDPGRVRVELRPELPARAATFVEE
jgi:hypothetical protein